MGRKRKGANQDIEIRILPERGIVNDVYINASTGVSTEVLEVSKKAKFHIYSTLEVPINVEQQLDLYLKQMQRVNSRILLRCVGRCSLVG